MEEKFYNKIWFMWIMLIFLAPVGIYLLWKHKRYSKNARIALSIFFIIIFLFAIKDINKDNMKDTNGMPQQTQEQKQEKTKKEETKEPTIDPSTMDLTQDNIKASIKDVIKPEEIVSIDITKMDSGSFIDVTYDPGTVWDEKSLVKGNANNAVGIMEILFKNPNIAKVRLWTQTEMTDEKGNTKKEQVVNVALTKETAKDINWKNFKDMVLVDYRKLFNIADSKFIYPTILQKLNQ